MNVQVPCNPVPAAELDGFQFGQDQDGSVVARCVFCKVGLVVTNENAAETRHAMIRHLATVHGPGCFTGKQFLGL